METVVIKVEGMMCPRCVAHVDKACLSVSGVQSAKADLDNACVEIVCDGEESLAKAKANIIEADYIVKD